MIATRSGLVALSHAVAADFLARGIPANVAAVGWRYRAQNLNQGEGGAARVLFIPGRERDGDEGSLEKPRHTSSNPRNLAQWRRIVTMSVWAVDTSDTANDELQIEAAELLLEQSVQAVHRAKDPASGKPLGLANIIWGSVRTSVGNKDLAFGREMLVEFQFMSTLFDISYDTAAPQPHVTRSPIIP